MPDAAPDAGVVALRQAVADVSDLLGAVDGEPLSLRDAERSVTYLWGTYWGGKWDQLTGLIPQTLIGLRATLHAADATTRPKAAEQLAWCYSVAAATLTHLRQPDAGFMAARRALDFVAGGDDALLAAVLKGSVSWQLLLSGRFLDAERVAVRTAESIDTRGVLMGSPPRPRSKWEQSCRQPDGVVSSRGRSGSRCPPSGPAGLGLHVLDYDLALGDIAALVAEQSACCLRIGLSDPHIVSREG